MSIIVKDKAEVDVKIGAALIAVRVKANKVVKKMMKDPND